MHKIIIASVAVVASAFAAVAFAQQPAKIDQATVDRTVAATFKSAPADWLKRIEQDETQKVCTQYRNELPKDEFAKVLARESATVAYPADGVVLGDWKAGEKVAQTGTGGQFSDGPTAAKGGNCYACHQMSRAELSFGTLGPSLLEYGKIRKFAVSDAKAAYGKIYNAQSVLPCSNMPRFGHNKFLTDKDIKDLVALLFDPESPVNK
jgi:L-cysteine S-thiosulfotransferase